MIKYSCPYLNFDGNAAEAIELYTAALGASVAELMHWKDMPGEEVPPEMAGRIMHCRLDVGGGHVFLSDLPPHMALKRGSDTSVLLEFDDPDALDRAFAALSEGGSVPMPLENTFWQARFGKVIDRFGIGWMMNCQLPQS